MKKDKIYIQQWLEFHPNEKPFKSDYYYLQICNKVDEVLQLVDFSLFKDNTEQNRKDLACVLTCWFEDLVSDFGLWNAFIRKHYEMYGMYIPFYETDEYYDGEINPQDIAFLIWHFISVNYFNDMIFSPISESIKFASSAIYYIFDEAWDEAPVNKNLQELKHLPASATFQTVRDAIGWVVLDSYLFYKYGRDNELNAKEAINDLLKDENLNHDLDKNRLMGVLYGIQDDAIHNTITHLLALKGKDWLALILGDTHPLYKTLLEMGDKKYGAYQYLGKDNQHTNVRHIASGKTIGIRSESILTEDLVPRESLIVMGIVKWKGEWVFTGSYMADKINDKIVQSEKSDLQKVGLFTDDNIKKEHIREHFEYFLAYNNNKPIAFFMNHKEQVEFVNGFFEFYNTEIARKSGKDIPTDFKTKNLPFSKDEDETDEDDNGIVLFFNQEIGLEIAPKIAAAIPDKDNPYYVHDKKDNEEIIQHILFDDIISPEFTKHLIKNYNLPALYFFDKQDSYLIHENLDFILRFYKRERFHAKPLVTMIE